MIVEVRLKPESTARFDTISKFVGQYLEQDEQIYIPSVLEGWQSQSVLSQNVEVIRAAESSKSFAPSAVRPLLNQSGLQRINKMFS